jgi:hypothetical protein
VIERMTSGSRRYASQAAGEGSRRRSQDNRAFYSPCDNIIPAPKYNTVVQNLYFTLSSADHAQVEGAVEIASEALSSLEKKSISTHSRSFSNFASSDVRG